MDRDAMALNKAVHPSQSDIQKSATDNTAPGRRVYSGTVVYQPFPQRTHLRCRQYEDKKSAIAFFDGNSRSSPFVDLLTQIPNI